jgi:murein DD-endopeptidase MepM/ murein hydrolase activator NlpD
MKRILLASAAIAVLFPSIYSRAADFSAVGSLEKVVCIGSGTLSVRSDDLNTVLFNAEKNARLKVFQGWGDTKKTKLVGGVSHSYSKVQFLDRESSAVSVGWVADTYIKPQADCAYFPKEGVVASEAPVSTQSLSTSCCRFPLKNRPTASYTTAPRSFGSARDGGARTHAAADLYRPKGESVVAVTSGTVIRNLYFFYQGTYAMEVQHSGGFVVRYGEVTGSTPVRGGQKVSEGQTVGYVGKTSCCTPMLHFELYSGKASGPLSTSTGKFRRRSDLLNPTAYLNSWIARTASVVE